MRTRFSCCVGVYRSLSVVIQRLKLYRTFGVDAKYITPWFVVLCWRVLRTAKPKSWGRRSPYCRVGVVIAQMLRRLYSLNPLQTKDGFFVQPSILLRQWSGTAGPIDIPFTGRSFSTTFACNIYTVSIQLGSFFAGLHGALSRCHVSFTRISTMQPTAFFSLHLHLGFRSIRTWDAASIRPVDVITSRPVVGKRL